MHSQSALNCFKMADSLYIATHRNGHWVIWVYTAMEINKRPLENSVSLDLKILSISVWKLQLGETKMLN